MTDIAANQPLKLTFSQDIDPTQIIQDVVSLRTPTGASPEGEWVVRGNVLEFIPRIRVAGGITNFGFANGETYLLTLPDVSATGQALRSTSGDPLSRSLSCSLQVSRGIVDLDSAPPRAKVLAPAATQDVPRETPIILEFSEIIDITPFNGATTATTPIRYRLRKTMPNPNGPGRVCDPNSSPILLEGIPVAENLSTRQVTVVTLRPAVNLPNQVCLEVVVTDQVKDLSGKAAEPTTYQFFTEIVFTGEASVDEVFASDSQLDKDVSSGSWGQGRALPPQVGGMGELGRFDLAAGKATSDPKVFVWNTDNQTISGAFTPSGQPITVTDGIFEFTDFVLPVGTTLLFEGSNPAQIRVRGKMVVNGTISVSAPDMPFYLAKTSSGPSGPGEQGGKGGPFGGSGGQGGDACQNTGAAAAYNGRDGNDVMLVNGHAYASAATGTGGGGSPLFPASGSTSAFNIVSNSFCGQLAAGGAGGGYHQPGDEGVATFTKAGNTSANLSDDGGTPGIGFDIGSQTPGSGVSSVDFFAVGGSGGGGGGSHPFMMLKGTNTWTPGSGGSGGGGVLILRVGQDLEVSTTGRLESKGGLGYKIDASPVGNEPGESIFNVPAPGGGGSGGTILLQVFGTPSLLGLIDTSGGKGGVLDTSSQASIGMEARGRGGEGAAGYYRLETPGGASTVQLGNGIPVGGAKNVGPLLDSEDRGISQSKFYSTRLTFMPTFLRYEMEVTINGTPLFYTDDEDFGNTSSPKYRADYAGPAKAGSPVRFQVQGAKVSPVSGLPDLETLGSWFDAVNDPNGLDLNDHVDSEGKQNATGFRFRLTYEPANKGDKIEVKRISVIFVE